MQATINGIRMNYEVTGSESTPPIVLHHPLATNLSIWDEITEALSPRYRVVRFDARGHGKTEAAQGSLQLRDADRRHDRPDRSPQNRSRALPRPVDRQHGGAVHRAAEP